MVEIGTIGCTSESHAFNELPVLGGIFRIALHAIEHRHVPFMRRQVLNCALPARRISAQGFQKHGRNFVAGAGDGFEGGKIVKVA